LGTREEKRDLSAQADRFIPQKRAGWRRAHRSESGKKKRRPASFELTRRGAGGRGERRIKYVRALLPSERIAAMESAMI